MGTVQELENLMKKHNWYYEHTAIGSQWRQGNEIQEKIYNLMKQVGKKVAVDLWNKYAPKNKAAGGKPMFPFPKHLVKEMEGDKISGGKGDKTNPKDVDQNELKVGIAVEMEHTSDAEVAKEIALDHLTENPKYYTELIKSGIVDEKEALKLAKDLGMSEAVQINHLRRMIKEEVTHLLENGDKSWLFKEIRKLEEAYKVINASPLLASKLGPNGYGIMIKQLWNALKVGLNSSKMDYEMEFGKAKWRVDPKGYPK